MMLMNLKNQYLFSVEGKFKEYRTQHTAANKSTKIPFTKHFLIIIFTVFHVHQAVIRRSCPIPPEAFSDVATII